MIYLHTLYKSEYIYIYIYIYNQLQNNDIKHKIDFYN